MRNIRTAVLAGVAALCVAGTAMAASQDSHVMTVNLPDGSVAHVEYRGDVAPQVRIDPNVRWIPIRFVDPLGAAPFDRIFAEMDRQTETMMRQVEALRSAPVDKGASHALVGPKDLPAGTVSYRFVSVRDGNQVCTRSWQMTAQGPGEQPKLISASSGDCDEKAAGRLAAKPMPAATGSAEPPTSPTV